MAKFCQECGAAISEGAKFCNSCGAKIIYAQPAQQQAAPAVSAQAAQPQNVNPYSQPAQPVYRQPVYQQPVYQQPVQPVYYQQPVRAVPVQVPKQKKSSNGFLYVCLTIIGVALIIAGAIIIPGRIKEAKKPDFPMAAATEEDFDWGTIDWSSENLEEAPSGNVPLDVAPTENTPPDNPFNGELDIPGVVDIDDTHSTYDRPEFEEFNWYLSDVKYQGVPDGVTELKTPAERAGGWKSLIIIDNVDEYGNSEYIMCNVSIVNKSESASEVWFDWYVDFMTNSEAFDMTEDEDTCLEVDIYDQGYRTYSPSQLDLFYFYEYYGTQYALGTLLDVNGVMATVLLMR